jgi:predicted transposase YbfD/YdcC
LEVVLKTGNNCILQVKENQKNLLKQCKYRATVSKNFKKSSAQETKGHGRKEVREIFVFDRFCDYQKVDPEWKDNIKQIVLVKRTREIFNTKEKSYNKSIEWSYYISTLEETPEFYQKAIRDHWGIENRNHNVRDGSFNEDKSRIRTNPTIMARLRSLTLSIMRINKEENISLCRFKNLATETRIFNYKYL